MRATLITILVTLTIVSAFDLPKLRKLASIVHSHLRIKSSPSTAADITQVVKGNTNFALDLFKSVTENEGNVIISPYSISVAMGMTFAGSHGDTKSQIKDTLHFENEHTHAVFRDINARLLKSGREFQVKLANSYWADKNYKFNQDYVDLVRDLYKGDVRSVDFKGESEAARKSINEWTDAQTDGKIKEILASKLPPNTKLVLVNAIYFKAGWASPFEVIGKKSFTMLNGENTSVEMMQISDAFNSFKGSGFKAVRLPYKGGRSAMTVILPDAGKFSEVKKNLNTQTLSQIFSARGKDLVEVTMPKFKIETELKLKDTFEKLGMEDAFTPKADFSRMDGTRDLYLDNVHHKAVIDVNEYGTEAAAATAVVVHARGIPPQFIANRPFIYVIHDEYHSVIFMGQVDRPSY